MNAATLRRILSIAALALLVVCCESIASACPNCKDALAQNDPAGAGVARGYALSIMFMLSMPYLIFVGLGTYFYLLVRQARKQKLAAAAKNVPVEPELITNEEPVVVS